MEKNQFIILNSFFAKVAMVVLCLGLYFYGFEIFLSFKNQKLNPLFFRIGFFLFHGGATALMAAHLIKKINSLNEKKITYSILYFSYFVFLCGIITFSYIFNFSFFLHVTKLPIIPYPAGISHSEWVDLNLDTGLIIFGWLMLIFAVLLFLSFLIKSIEPGKNEKRYYVDYKSSLIFSYETVAILIFTFFAMVVAKTPSLNEFFSKEFFAGIMILLTVPLILSPLFIYSYPVSLKENGICAFNLHHKLFFFSWHEIKFVELKRIGNVEYYYIKSEELKKEIAIPVKLRKYEDFLERLNLNGVDIALFKNAKLNTNDATFILEYKNRKKSYLIFAVLLVSMSLTFVILEKYIPKKISEFDMIKQKAESGDAGSQFSLGSRYDTGIGTKKNETEAFYWFQKAAVQGHPCAAYHTGSMYREGKVIQQDYQKARHYFTIAADKNIPEAKLDLGNCYALGFGVEKNPVIAFKYYLMAAEQGLISSQFNVACAYYHGEGTDQDYTKAFKWYQKAAKQGHSKSQKILALMYGTGRGVEQNPVQEFAWTAVAIAFGENDLIKVKEKLLSTCSDEEILEARKMARMIIRSIKARRGRQDLEKC